MSKVNKFQWGFRWCDASSAPQSDVYLHRGINGSYIIKFGSLNHSDPICEGDLGKVVRFLKSRLTTSDYAKELLNELQHSKWEMNHGKWWLTLPTPPPTDLTTHASATGSAELLDENRQLRAENARLRGLMRGVLTIGVGNPHVYIAHSDLFDEIVTEMEQSIGGGDNGN